MLVIVALGGRLWLRVVIERQAQSEGAAVCGEWPILRESQAGSLAWRRTGVSSLPLVRRHVSERVPLQEDRSLEAPQKGPVSLSQKGPFLRHVLGSPKYPLGF